MINELIFYGNTESLLNLKGINFDQFIDERWNINCFGVDAHAYVMDLPTEEQLVDLQKTFMFVGGFNQHEFQLEEATASVCGWAKRTLYRDGALFRSLGLLPDQREFMPEVRKKVREKMTYIGAQSAARAVPRYSENTAVQYLINAERVDINDLPNLWDIGKVLLDDWKQNKDKITGKDTVGGDGATASPINSSKIMFMNPDRTIIVGHWHALQQLYHPNTLIFGLRQLNFVNSNYNMTYPDIHHVMADYLGIEVREIL